MAKPVPRKRNPTDATMRNARAALARDEALRARIVHLEKRVTRLEALTVALSRKDWIARARLKLQRTRR